MLKKEEARAKIKVKSERDGDKVKQKFLMHVGSVEDIQKVVCSVQNDRTA